MSDDVSITFRSRIEPGETSFLIEIQRKFAEDPKRMFGFESITLMPEYQNTQAYAYKLDSKKELKSEVKHSIQLEIQYGEQFYPKNDPTKVWVYATSMKKVDVLMKSLNQHYEKTKPAGTFLPPLFLDYLNLQSLDEEETLRGYQQNTAMEAYGEEFDPAKHATWLPPSLSHMKDFNNCIFPTTDDMEYMEDIRIRIWVGPNTTITFSNTHLLEALGFQPHQIPARNNRNQIPLENNNPLEYKCFIAWNVPQIELNSNELKGTRVNAYLTNTVMFSPLEELVTIKENERQPIALCEDYSKVFRSLAKKMNIYMDLQFDQVGKKFKIVFPTNPNIFVRVFLPVPVMTQLGLDPSQGDSIDQRSTFSPVSTNVDTADLAQKAQALVYDTGMVAVDLYEQTSQLSSHSGNTLMATLHPRLDGTLRNRVYFGDVPRVRVSSTNPNLKFAMYRFDDLNKKSELGWPVGAYVFGVLTGKV
jgi:hypothetical protein